MFGKVLGWFSGEIKLLAEIKRKILCSLYNSWNCLQIYSDISNYTETGTLENAALGSNVTESSVKPLMEVK